MIESLCLLHAAADGGRTNSQVLQRLGVSDAHASEIPAIYSALMGHGFVALDADRVAATTQGLVYLREQLELWKVAVA